MSAQNKVLTTLNQPLSVGLYSLGGVTPQLFTTIEGVPLGTVGNTQDGELAAKVIVVGGTLTASPGGLAIPVSDDIQITYVGLTNNIDQVIYSLLGSVVATLQMTYLNAGAANDDLLIEVQKL